MELKFLHKNNKHPALKQKLTFGQKASDAVSAFCGSWKFIIIVVGFLIVWIIINVVMLIKRWDPYPFILLNFILSCLAALQAPIILMSQNRAAQKDRLRAEYDYKVNRKAEREVTKISKDLEAIKRLTGKR